MSDRYSVARQAAEAGAEIAFERFEQDITINTKEGDLDFVTDADISAQESIVETIHESYPDDVIVGEEGDELKRVPETGDAWIIDPIDGTTNFIHGFKTWGAAIAAVRDGEPITSVINLPVIDDEYADDDSTKKNGEKVAVSETEDIDQFLAAPTLRYTLSSDDRQRFTTLTDIIIENLGDMRRIGCAQATLAMVAAGSIDATISPFKPNAYDTVAGAHMIELAGGTVTDLSGNSWTRSSRGIVASNGNAHEELIELLEEYGLDS